MTNGGFATALATFLSLADQVSTNEFVVAAFRQLEAASTSDDAVPDDAIDRRHTRQLIAALALVFFVSFVLIVSVALFRCFILYCQSYENTRRFHSPLYRRTSATTYTAAHQRVTFAAPPTTGHVANGGTAYTFQSIFHEGAAAVADANDSSSLQPPPADFLQIVP